MAERKSVPDIRFAGFGGDWERRKLGDAFDFLQNNTLSRSELSLDHGEAKNVHYGDILVKFGEYLDVSKMPLPFISDRHIVDKFKASLLQDGDVVVADTAEDEAVGKCVEMAGVQGVPIISGLHTIPMRPAESFAAGYLGYYLNSDAYRDQLLPLMQGIKVMSISKSAIQDTDVSFPMDVAEQAVIGRYFIQLDGCITSLQCKLAALANFKKAMLDKMFPKDGAAVPEIRFNGFSGDWEQRRIEEITVESLEYTTLSSGLPLLTSSRNGLMYQNEYRGNQTTESAETLFSIVPLGACTYRHMSDDDVFHLNINTVEKGLVSREYPVFSATEENDIDFIVQHMNSSASFRAFCAEQKKGGTRTRLYYRTLCEFKMMVPKLEEQKQISKALLQLDDLIALHQRKLDCLRNIKEACLEKMFV